MCALQLKMMRSSVGAALHQSAGHVGLNAQNLKQLAIKPLLGARNHNAPRHFGLNAQNLRHVCLKALYPTPIASKSPVCAVVRVVSRLLEGRAA